MPELTFQDDKVPQELSKLDRWEAQVSVEVQHVNLSFRDKEDKF